MSPDPVETNPLQQVLEDLSALLQPGDAAAGRRIAERLADEDLDQPGAAPAWLVALLAAVRDRRATGWTDFSRPDTDDTNVFEVVRGLPDLLPVSYENNEESWLLGFPALDMEACISLEGSTYKVSPTGTTWQE